MILADTHVHVYPGHDLGAVLRAGRNNLCHAARDAGMDPAKAAFALFLAECGDCDFFVKLASGAMRLSEPLLIERTGDPEGLWIRDDGGFRILLVAGRQLVSKCRLEVLALALRPGQEVRGGGELSDLIVEVKKAGAVPVLPWAPGKWTGIRGRTVLEWMSREENHGAMPADTSFRPVGWREPAPFAAARSRGISVLAGTDPLPLPGEERRVGTYGIAIRGGLDPGCPVQSLCEAISAGGREVKRIGSRRSFPEIVRKQVALRVR